MFNIVITTLSFYTCGIASLGSIQFVSNIIFVSTIHKEKVTRGMVLSTCSIIVGNILVVIFSDHEATLITGDELINIYSVNMGYQIYLAVVAVLFVVMTLVHKRYYSVRVHEKRSLWKHAAVEPFAYTVSSTIVGTQAVLFSKSLSMLIQVTAWGIRNEFVNWELWVTLVLWLLFVSFWLKRFDTSLSLYPPMFIIPGT